MKSQQEIFQSLFDAIADELKEDWNRLEIFFRLNHEIKSAGYTTWQLLNHYLNKKVYYSDPASISDYFWELSDSLSGDGAREKITHGYILFTADGDFEAKYSYQEPNWRDIATWHKNIDFE